MQTFHPPDEGPLQGLVASRIEAYGGRHRASAQNAAGGLYPRGGLVLVSPGYALKVTWGGKNDDTQLSSLCPLAGSWAALFLSLTPGFFPGL